MEYTMRPGEIALWVLKYLGIMLLYTLLDVALWRKAFLMEQNNVDEMVTLPMVLDSSTLWPTKKTDVSEHRGHSTASTWPRRIVPSVGTLFKQSVVVLSSSKEKTE